MLSYGKLKLETSSINLGIEFSGIRGDGSSVMGIDSNCLSQHLSAPPLLWKVPSYMTLSEAATIPCVYATVLYCLDHCARIQPKQTILIHAGAGNNNIPVTLYTASWTSAIYIYNQSHTIESYTCIISTYDIL